MNYEVCPLLFDWYESWSNTTHSVHSPLALTPLRAVSRSQQNWICTKIAAAFLFLLKWSIFTLLIVCVCVCMISSDELSLSRCEIDAKWADEKRQRTAILSFIAAKVLVFIKPIFVFLEKFDMFFSAFMNCFYSLSRLMGFSNIKAMLCFVW